LRFFYEHAATGDKDHGCDKAKDSKKVPVHALGYILIVFEVIILSGRIVWGKSLHIFFSSALE
jgi:hypothetical protein